MFAGLGWAKGPKGGCKNGVVQSGKRKGKCLKNKRTKKLGGKGRKSHKGKGPHCKFGKVKSGARKGRCLKHRRARKS